METSEKPNQWRAQATFLLFPILDCCIDATTLVGKISFLGGSIEVWIPSAERLTIRIIPPKSPTYVFVTRPLHFVSDAHFEVSILCDCEKALLWINGEPAGSKGYAIDNDLPLNVVLPTWAEDQRLALADFVTKSAQEAVARRRAKFLNRKPKPRRRAVEREEYFSALRGELNQLHDLARLVREGATHHIVGASARLRSLVCYMKNENNLPLLQTCAAFDEQRLPVFVPPPHWADFENFPNVEGISRIFAEKLHPGLIEVDLDVWLKLPGYRHGQVDYNNNDILRNLAETLGGAHYDHSVDIALEQMDFFEYPTCIMATASPSRASFLLEVMLTVEKLGRNVLDSCSKNCET